MITACVPLAYVIRPSPKRSTEKVASIVPPEVEMVPLMAIVAPVPTLVTTIVSPLAKVPLSATLSRLSLASNSTEPESVPAPVCAPPMIENGGLAGMLRLPSAPL